MMDKRILRLSLVLLPVLMASCAPKATQPEASPSPPSTFTAPINNAKQKANDIQQKALEREQMTPEGQVQPSPSPTN